ncbi:putative peptidoglycan-binding domain-containing protein [Bacteroides sp. HPS0048]|uniref:putative peptidoglycan-binding domain-containing protein n=1 Tax=Bacteroides sp. HPS0048 TaxID=1078089 RepID=UPI0021018804|nr:putative peptidoglycan-binding domain-containing protein [Bacteroides sp. HPS0048]
MSEEDAVNCVMKPHYWDKWQADQIKSQSVANLVVDWVWASGIHGIKGVQEILGVTVDGIVGVKTIAALNDRNARELFAEIKRARVSFIEGIIKRDPSQIIFKRGWLTRLNNINYGSLILNKRKDNVLKFTDV